MRAVLGEELRQRLGPLFEGFAEPLYVWQRATGGDLVLIAYNEAAARLPSASTERVLGRSAREAFGESLPHFVADLEESARSGALRREMDYVFMASGAERRLLVSYTPLDPDLVVVATRDLTDFWERAREERQRRAELEELAALTQALLECEEPQQARDTLCQAARSLAGADGVYLMERVGDDLVQTAAASARGVPDHEPIRHPVTATSVSGEAYRTRERIFVGDVVADGRTSRAAYERSGMQSGFFQPVVVGERVLGVLVVAWGHPLPSPPQRAVRLMPVLASQAGALIKRTDRLASLTELAGKDPLTGLPNRRFWDEELLRTLSVASRQATPVCVVVLDVNGLKEVNDRQGHQAGDALLRDAARSWGAQLRSEDLLARLGGDEFGVLVPGLRRAAAEAIVRRLTEAAPHLSAAAGVVEWDGAESAEVLLHRADEAMYVDKRAR